VLKDHVIGLVEAPRTPSLDSVSCSVGIRARPRGDDFGVKGTVIVVPSRSSTGKVGTTFGQTHQSSSVASIAVVDVSGQDVSLEVNVRSCLVTPRAVSTERSTSWWVSPSGNLVGTTNTEFVAFFPKVSCHSTARSRSKATGTQSVAFSASINVSREVVFDHQIVISDVEAPRTSF